MWPLVLCHAAVAGPMHAEPAAPDPEPQKPTCIQGDCTNGWGARRLPDGTIEHANFREGGLALFVRREKGDRTVHTLAEGGRVVGMGEIHTPAGVTYVSDLYLPDGIERERHDVAAYCTLDVARSLVAHPDAFQGAVGQQGFLIPGLTQPGTAITFTPAGDLFTRVAIGDGSEDYQLKIDKAHRESELAVVARDWNKRTWKLESAAPEGKTYIEGTSFEAPGSWPKVVVTYRFESRPKASGTGREAELTVHVERRAAPYP